MRVIGCRCPRRTPGAGSVRSTHSASSRAASAASSNSRLRASRALSSCCFARFNTCPMRLRSSGESLPIPLLISASAPLRPSASTRTASSSAAEPAAAMRPSVRAASSCMDSSSMFMESLIVARGDIRPDNGSMALEFTTSHLSDSLTIFRYYKKLAEHAMAQVSGEELTRVLDGEMNSIAHIVKHLAGNMRSRWTDFLTTDGEKPGRDRDSEFTAPPATRAEVMELWEQGWDYVWRALGPLEEADLTRTIAIRGEKHSVMQAINRQLAHYPYHVGQIVMLAKHFRAGQWKSLTMPKNKVA